MRNAVHQRNRRLFAIAAAAVLLWGLLGLFQARDRGETGYDTGWGAEVTRVEPGGPADAAGLEAGDRILSVDGTPVQGPWVFPSRDRVGVEGSQTLQVERRGETRIVEIAWNPLTAGQFRTSLVDGLLVTAFMGFGLWAFLSTGTRPALLLAVFGLCFGVANYQGPSLGLPGVAIAFVRSNLSLFYTALLCHFLLLFPKPKGFLRRRSAGWVLYAPFLFFLAFGCLEWFVFPALRAAYATTALFSDSLYMLVGLGALIHSGISLPRAERRASGFYWIPLGLLVAIAPPLLLEIVGMALSDFAFPGGPYLPLLGAAIPAGLALAAVTDGRRQEELRNGDTGGRVATTMRHVVMLLILLSTLIGPALGADWAY